MSEGTNRIITPLIVVFVLLTSIPAQQRQKVCAGGLKVISGMSEVNGCSIR